MATCPACGIEAGGESGECPRCHLSATLFSAVREAAGPGGDSDPTYLRTIGELLASVEFDKPATLPVEPVHGLLSRPALSEDLPKGSSLRPTPRAAPAIDAGIDLPVAPARVEAPPELKRRAEDYFQVARRLGLDFTDFRSRANSAALVDDVDSLEILTREMFVHLSSATVEEYEALLARRNELVQLVPTASADLELAAVRRAIGLGDLGGAQRRLEQVRDRLATAEQEWEVGRILVAEGEMMVATIRELGGDATPAAGPLEEGRKLFVDGRRTDAERVLARAAVALWTLLEPRLLSELHRLRDRMVEERSAGLDIAPAVRELRAVSVELRKRNFVGTIVSFRRLRSAVDRTAPPGPESVGEAELTGPVRTGPPA
ncbi:MAG: hypothetical protein ACREDE_07965 [Thermoplasmata archaeon]